MSCITLSSLREFPRSRCFGLLAVVWTVHAGQAWGQDAKAEKLSYLGPEPGPRQAETNSVPLAETNRAAEWFGGQAFWEWSRLTGDWGRVRPGLEAERLTLAGRDRTDISSVLAGGIRDRTIEESLLDLNATFDPKETLGVEGGLFFAQYYFRQGGSGSANAGDLKVYDNLDADHLSRAEEVWYQQKLWGDRLRLKLGQVDANAEFDYVNAAGEFINASSGYSPTLTGLPTYPEPAVSVNLFVYPTKWWYAGAGVYGDNFRQLSVSGLKHPYVMGEAGLTHDGSGGLGPARIAAGFWQNFRGLDRFDGGRNNRTTGLYIVAEQQVWKERPGSADDAQGVSVFAQYGRGDGNVSPFEDHVGIGASALGLLPGRDADSMGIYWTWARSSRAAGSGLSADEGSLELYYCFQATKFLGLKPDFIWIRNPGGVAGRDDAYIATLRVTLVF